MFFVRTAGPRDLQKIRTLLLVCFDEAFASQIGVAELEKLKQSQLSEAALKTRLEKRDGEFLVADDGKTFAGIGYAVMSSDMVKTATLDLIYVAGPHQRNGIGKDIFAELETCFPDAEIMRADVGTDNHAARAFMGSVGFSDVDQLASVADDNGTARIVFEKRLGR
jgi:GNAT superfamily N-acetyltransferase